MLDQTSAGGPPNGEEPRGGSALREALRRARIEAAQQTDVVIDLRQGEIARLEMLRDELDPVFAQVPREIDLFDVGLVPGDRPRLFVDMVSFVEMSRDRRVYRFMRDGRHGRICAAESDRTEPIVEAVTAYVARRLIERERLLADEDRLTGAATPSPISTSPADPAPASATPAVAEEVSPATTPAEAPAASQAKPRSRRWLRALTILSAFVLGGALGAAVVGGVIYAVAKGFLPV